MNNSSLNTAFGEASGHSHPKRKRTSPLSIRLSDEEKAQLQREAGGGSVHALAKARVLNSNGKAVAPTRSGVKVDHAALAQVLAKLGQSRLSSNMNQIARAANAGALPVSEELCRELRQACSDIAAMRKGLIAALGLKPKDDADLSRRIPESEGG